MIAACEQHLIKEAKDGSHEAFRELVKLNMKRAYNIAYSFLNDHHQAEEITQEAFVKVYTSLNSFREEAQFRTWLHRIIVNLSINQLRKDKRTRTREVPQDNVKETEGFLPVPAEREILTAHLYRALHELPTLQRSVVILRHLDGFSTKEVSRILRCSEGTVKTHLFRGLRKLKTKLRFLGGEEG
jgi:RNA polymerase sigma-70 factor (ECF subfamily)